MYCRMVYSLCVGAVLLSFQELERIGEKIWHNESRQCIEGLTVWNEGEAFPSFGIGHFIWYPEEELVTFQETLPHLIEFLQSRGIEPPLLFTQKRAPWKTRKEFLQEFHSQEMMNLRSFLQETTALQTEFMVLRFEQAVSQMLLALPLQKKEAIACRIQHLLQEPSGSYRLVDYVNFKGIGLSPAERYSGEGWGLLQVLEEMQGDSSEHFVEAAQQVLRRRVKNAPTERNEKKWLQGWLNRVETYR